MEIELASSTAHYKYNKKRLGALRLAVFFIQITY